MVAAPLTAEATLPHSTRGETAIASTARTIWVTGPASSAAVAAVPGFGGYRRLGQGQPERAAEGGDPAGLRDVDGQRPPGRGGAEGRGQQPGAQPELRDRGRHPELDGGGRAPGRRREPLADLADPAGQRVR